MDGSRSESIGTPVISDSSTTSPAKNRNIQENFKLTFYPDQASVEDREKMQKIWNRIESESKFEKMDVDVFTSNKRKVDEKSVKNDSKIAKEVADNFKDEDKQSNETVTNCKEKAPEISPGIALELLNHFRELHITEACVSSYHDK
ncbi:uncharacterized protein LOC111047314 [Nilaparvata lugens]|uniref:uncharacterized protein LOC111047314 n=1 Tax=Nilaparvata lugens TaxID=108931 RepID=UPI00193D3223|nr:uncharacterized protein LOC111047314 [Nilaparvata lugens]